MTVPSLTDIQVSATNRLLEALRESEQKMRQRIDLLVEMVFELDKDQNIVFFNSAWAKVLGYAEVANSKLSDYIAAEDIPILEHALTTVWSEEKVSLMLKLRHFDGRLLYMEASFVAMGNNVVGAFHDVTQQHLVQEELKFLAQYDSLTKLANRSLFHDRLEQSLSDARAHGKPLAIAFLDVDNFKKINDTFGHAFGDQVLFNVANRIRQLLRTTDTIARFGGDEFVILLNDVESEQSCKTLLKKVLDAFVVPFQIQDQQLSVSTSIGVTLYPKDDQEDCDQLIRHADQAMYLAKESGKNQIHFFDTNNHHAHNSQLRMVGELKAAILKNELIVFYQPIVDLSKKQLIGAEALLRWEHPVNGLTFPDAFLPLVQHHPIMIEIGQYVIKKVLAQMTRWNQMNFCIRVSINIGGLQMQDQAFYDDVCKVLVQFSEVLPQQIQFEVVETTQLTDVASMSDLIKNFKRLGISFALDDFGTGYSSLSNLRSLPIDTIKIDKSFVMNMRNDEEDLLIVKSIISLSKAFKCRVLAEGVESVAVLESLKALDCHLAQGYFFSKALPAEAFYAWSHQPNRFFDSKACFNKITGH